MKAESVRRLVQHPTTFRPCMASVLIAPGGSLTWLSRGSTTRRIFSTERGHRAAADGVSGMPRSCYSPSAAPYQTSPDSKEDDDE